MKKTLILVVLGVVLYMIVASAFNRSQQPTYTQGYITSRAVVVHNCTPGAIKSGAVTEAQAEQYCGCVYDEGVAQYGGAEFTSMLEDLQNTNTLTPQMNDIVNSCAAKI